MTARDWRDAKLPQWAKDAVQAEIDQWRLTAALAWPTEAKPEPLSFWWGDYDKLTGSPVPGKYWAVPSSSRIEAFELQRIAALPDNDKGGMRSWKEWVFRQNDGWTTNCIRGPLFDSERDAKLYRRWLMCEDFARQLMRAAQ